MVETLGKNCLFNSLVDMYKMLQDNTELIVGFIKHLCKDQNYMQR